MQRFITGFRHAIWQDWPILMALSTLSVVVLAILSTQGIGSLMPGAWKENTMLYGLVLSIFAVGKAAGALSEDRPAHPIAYLYRLVLSDRCLIPLQRGLPMLAAMILWMPIFSTAKSALPLFVDFTWDPALARVDRLIFGTDAWRVLQPALGYPLVTSILSYTYHAWLVLIFVGGIFFAFFVEDREVRAQYFITRFAIWSIMGLGLASAFASLGPCFVGPLHGDHRFDAQMAYLYEANTHYRVMVLPVQEELLLWFRNGHYGLGGGISAMPSMHVAMTLLTALAAWRVSRVAGACLYLCLAVICLGSVHLGYHYAIDGLVSITCTLLLWKASGVAAHWMAKRQARKAASEPLQPAWQPA